MRLSVISRLHSSTLWAGDTVMTGADMMSLTLGVLQTTATAAHFSRVIALGQDADEQAIRDHQPRAPIELSASIAMAS